MKIIGFLNDFAKRSRYYNIDSMMNTSIEYEDPLSDWYLLSQDQVMSKFAGINICRKGSFMIHSILIDEDPLSDWYLLSQDILNFSKKTKNISNK